MDRSAVDVLLSHTWKGNVRELRAVLERAALSSPCAVLSATTIEDALKHSSRREISPRQRKGLLQKQELERLIAETGGNVSEISRRLDLSRGAIYYRAKKFGVTID